MCIVYNIYMYIYMGGIALYCEPNIVWFVQEGRGMARCLLCCVVYMLCILCI